MPTMLRKLRVKRIDLVDKGANFDPDTGEGAHVLLYKSADGKPCPCDLCKAELEGESRGNLSDSDFAAVWTDAEGRKQRKLPIHDAAHVRNALARFNQTDMPASVRAKARAKLDSAAKKFGIGERDEKTEKSQPTSTEVNVDEMARCKKCKKQFKKGLDKCPECGAPMEPDEDDVEKVAADKSAEEERMADEKLKADLDAANAKIEGLEKERDDLKKRLETPEEIEKRKLEALPESVRKQLVDQAEEIAKMRSEKAENEQIETVKKSMPQIPGKAEDVGRLLKRLKDVAKKEDFEALTTMLKAASAQIEQGALYKEIGREGAPAEGDESPFAEVMRLVNEKVAKGQNLTVADAQAQVFREHPDLYARYARSVNAPASRD